MPHELQSEESQAAKVQSSLDLSVLNILPTVAAGTGGLYACFIALYWVLLPPNAAGILTVCALLTVAAMIGIYQFLQSRELSTEWTYPTLSTIFAFVLVNHAVHVALSPIPEQITNTAIIIIALGLIYLSIPWVIGAIACLLVLVVSELTFFAPNTLWGNHSFVLVGSVAVSIMVLKARRDNAIKLLGAQHEVKVRHHVEDTLHNIATGLLAAEPEDVAMATERALTAVRDCANADVSYIVQIHGNPPTLRMLHECQRVGKKVGTNAINGVQVNEFPWFWNRLQKEPVLAIDCVDEIPPEGAKEQAVYRAIGVQAFLAIPLMSKKGLWGYLGLVSLTQPRKWVLDDVRLVRTLARNFLIAIDRQSAYQEIESLTERLYHASRLISAGEMAAAWFHQQRTLFQSSGQFIVAAQNFLAQDPPALDSVSKVLRDLKDCCVTNEQTLTEFLAYIKTGATEHEPWSMLRLVEMASQLTTHQALEHKVQLDFTDASHNQQVRCSGNLIVQVIVNLVLNAVEILRNAEPSESPCISLKLTNETDDTVVLSVADNGPGVPPELASVIFERFFTTRTEGFGIGLFIGRKIMEAHGGRLELNTHHRPGCEFRLSLPLMPVDAPSKSDEDDDTSDSETGLNIDSDTIADSETGKETLTDFDMDSHVDLESHIDYDPKSDSDSDSEIAGTGRGNC
ncbi:GAF domain-containing sensor histidine kinase [Thalassoroseus pseudoceratinae]|uniref:GAF domain-containing sensor histidine kinase n=1 Tax=Thalassoroseus pseudoceratinae TaxID=2713176 RepID=UPI00141D80A7|nr:GAF domain-containing sensor histidine kinase [Thalassoroseus pseudoceratinae]